MPKRAPAGGNYLRWIDLATENGVVLVRVVEQGEPEDFGNGPTDVVYADVIVAAPKARAGEFYLREKIIGRAITSKLTEEEDGTVVCGRLVALKRGTNAYAALNEPSDAEFDGPITALYAAEGLELDAAGDAKLFRLYRDRTRDERTGDARAATSKAASTTKTSTRKSSRPAREDDDEPPF